MLIFLIFKTGNLTVMGTFFWKKSKLEMQRNSAFSFNIALFLSVLLETFASKSYVACDRGNTLCICPQTLSSVPVLDSSCTKYNYIWDFGEKKKKKGLIEILLGTWICPYNAGEHSFFFFIIIIYFYVFCHAPEDERWDLYSTICLAL